MANTHIEKEFTEKNLLNDTKEELAWWKGYAQSIESAIREMRNLINDSQGVAGYHLNGDIAEWDELIENSLFAVAVAEAEIASRKKINNQFKDCHVTDKLRDVLYIKEYENMPCTVQYTPVYGGVKYIKENKEQEMKEPTKCLVCKGDYATAELALRLGHRPDAAFAQLAKCQKGKMSGLDEVLYAVVYKDDGPSGPCGQTCSVTNPWTRLYLFSSYKSVKDFADKITKSAGRKNSRIEYLFHPQPEDNEIFMVEE